MNRYEEGKKVRRVSAVIYLLIMAFLVGGTYIAQQDRQAKEKENPVLIVPDKEQVAFPGN